MEHTQRILEECRLFTGVAAPILQRAATLGSLSQFGPQEAIYTQERFLEELGIVITGQATTSKASPDGKRMPMSILVPGDLFGAVAVFDATPQFETDIYAGNHGATILFLTKKDVIGLLRMDFTMVQNLVTYLCSRIRFLSKRVDMLFGADAKSKLLSYLYAQADETGTVVLERNMSRLAAQLSISRATLYRAFSSLIEEQVIEKNRNTITLLHQ
ncbi:Crp/Fnr family transcriptional regulator [Eubacteriales bacterium OttesenSCG-928-M02]|nr:Crp/Fnr family transcriptional regulator [Eubacteriales bacterium OttesenSCG-928-M02]